MMGETLYHGGPRGLKTILPPSQTGAQSVAGRIDPQVCRADRVYLTSSYAAAVMYAACLEKGTVYEVTPLSDLEDDPDCNTPGLSFQCRSAGVLRERRPKMKLILKARKALLSGENHPWP